ncbi:MAG: A/G-specific adenine glycosylase [Candidatus Binatia bacterium]
MGAITTWRSPRAHYPIVRPWATTTHFMGTPDAARVRQFRRRLLRWYTCHGRDLPWRRTRDPYRILVSEVMLQQTQVDRVIGYYPRFLQRYPTIDSLAHASSFEVREAWEGLGYYARARNLHRTAQRVTANHGGKLPADLDTIQTLPGIGRYTAGAVLSFAYGQRAAILDTNAARVLSRVFAIRRRPPKGRWWQRLWNLAEAVTPARGADRFNQAIMDLGATVCRARAPQCRHCPVRTCCRSAAG